MADWTKIRDNTLSTVFWAAMFAMPIVPMIGASDEAGARRILDNEGYSELEYKGKVSLKYGCHGGYLWRDSFVATDPAGKREQLTVCQGFTRGNHKIRPFDMPDNR